MHFVRLRAEFELKMDDNLSSISEELADIEGKINDIFRALS